jgi:hypothetical protein
MGKLCAKNREYSRFDLRPDLPDCLLNPTHHGGNVFRITGKHSAIITCASLIVLALAGCSSESPMPTEGGMAGINVSDLSQASSAQALNDLRSLTAPLHDLDAALAANYSLLVAPPLTASDGCISDMVLGGMGYHYSRFNNLGDNSINLLDPEFLVYAPTNAPVNGGVANRKLGALEYFIPYSNVWPGPADAGFVRAPRLSDFPSFAGLPDVAMSATQFGGWAIHIWLWENNPGGMLTNYNTAVPQCAG